MSEKIEKVTLYIENLGRGKVTIVDSGISVQDFPSHTVEGKQAVGLSATKVDVLKKSLKGFVGMVKVHHPHQLNILSAEEYEATRNKALGINPEKKKTPEEIAARELAQKEKAAQELAQKEKQIYEAAMNGGDDEILAYMNDYPKGQYFAEVEEWGDYLDTKETDTEEAFVIFLKKYPEGNYSAEFKTLLGV